METSKSEFCQEAWALALKYEMKHEWQHIESFYASPTYQVIPPMPHLQKCMQAEGNSELSNIGEA